MTTTPVALPSRMVLMLLFACSDPRVDGHADAPLRCGPAEVADGAVCVPEACGSGKWGDIGEAQVFVDAGADEGGDGSSDAPLRSIQAGLNAAAGGTVAVAAGRYAEVIELTTAHHGTRLAGRCREMVTVDGSEGEDDQQTLLAQGEPTSEWAVERLTITGGRHGGVLVLGDIEGGDGAGGVLSLYRVDVAANADVGVAAMGVGATLRMEHSRVADTKVAKGGVFGRGVIAEFGASVSVSDSTIERNHEMGVFALSPGTSVVLVRTRVSETAMTRFDIDGAGIVVRDGAAVTATDCTIEGNHYGGVLAGDDGSIVILTRTDVLNTETEGDGTGGWGVVAQGGAFVGVANATIRGNHSAGIAADGVGSLISLSGVSVTDTESDVIGAFGRGLNIENGARLTASDSVIRRNRDVGVSLTGAGTSVTLARSDVSATRAKPDGTRGWGVGVQDRASFSAVDCRIEDNDEVGVFAADEGTTAVLRRVSIAGQAADAPRDSRGVNVQNAASVEVIDSTILGSRGVGVFVAGRGASVRMEASEVAGTEPKDGGAGGRGISVQAGGVFVGTACTVQNNHEIGIFADGEGASVSLTDCIVLGTRLDWTAQAAPGITAQRGAVVSATRTLVADNEGPGVYVVGNGAIACVGCTLTHNQFAGAVLLGGTLNLTSSVVDETIPSAIDGGGVGIFIGQVDPSGAEEFRAMVVTDTTVGAHPYAAVWLAAVGSYQIQNSTLTSGSGVALSPDLTVHGNALYVRDAAVDLVGNTFSGTSKATAKATILLDASAAALAGNAWSGTTDGDLNWDIVQQVCTRTSPLAETDGAPHARLCTDDWDVHVEDLSFAIYLDEAQAL